MKKSIDVLFFYEHFAREFDVACIIKSILEKKFSKTVKIAQWPLDSMAVLRKFLPEVVVLPFCYQVKSHNACFVEWPEAIYFNMAWEQLFYKGNQKAKSPRGVFATHHVIHHAWGKFYANFLKNCDVKPDNIFLNGHPAYQLYESPYRAFFPSKIQLSKSYGLDHEKNWLFFPENYNWAFYSEKTLQEFIRNGQKKQDVYKLRDYCLASLPEVLKWCESAANTYDAEIIIRPRPSTSIDDFEKVLDRNIPDRPASVHAIQEGTVREWILASDVVVSSHSTSLIEGALAGKPVFMLAPFKIPESLMVEWHSFLIPITSESEFLEMCGNPSNQNSGKELSDWTKRNMLGAGDAINNIAEHIDQLLEKKIERPMLPHLKDITYPPAFTASLALWPIIYGFRKMRGKLRRSAPIGEPRAVIAEYQKEIVSDKELNKTLNRWSDVVPF